MKHQLILLLSVTMLLMTQSAIASSTCESKFGFNESQLELTSTNDYLELNRKYIENVGNSVNKSPENRIEHNGFVYFSNADGLFVQHQNATKPSKINGFPQYTNIFLDKTFNETYFGTKNGLYVSKCGANKVRKIGATNNIDVDFGVIDSAGNVYFGHNGYNEQSSEELFVLRKIDGTLVKISGIEEQSLGSYTIESIRNPNKIAVDTNNNVYVGAYSGYIYLIKCGETKVTKLKDIKSSGGVTSIVVDSKDNVYFRTNNALYIIKNNETKLIKIFDVIDDFNYFLSVDERDNLFFEVIDQTYVLKSTEVVAEEITTISNINKLSVKNLQNFQSRNGVLYLTATSNGKDILCSIKQNETSLTEIYATESSVISLAVDTSNNIYFITFSDESKKYVSFIFRKNGKIPIEITGITGHLSHVFADNNNNIYFGSGNGLHILQEDEVTPFKLRVTESQISSFVVDKRDNVYFATDYDGAFVLKSGELEANRIDGINKNYGSYVEVYGDKKYDVIYFKTGGALYKLNGGEQSVLKVTEGYSPELYLSDCMNSTFYAQENKIFTVKNDSSAMHVTEVEGQVLYMNSDSLNNLYFISSKNELHLLRPHRLTSEILVKGQKLSSLNVDRDDNVYFATDGEVYVIKSGETEASKIVNINGEIQNFVTNGDDVFFVTSKTNNENGLFVVRNKLPFEAMFHYRNLGELDNNDDETIFNVLNYLNVRENYVLSKSKIKVVNKTPTSATVVAVKGMFRGKFNVTFAIKNNDKVGNNFQLIELLEKAIFFDHLNKNSYNFKNNKILNISVSTDNLKFYPVEIATNSEPSSSIEFKNICFNKKRVANTSPLPQTITLPECNYETKEIILFQITSGLKKTDGNIEGSLESVLNSQDENSLLNFGNPNKNQNVQPKMTLSSAFDLSNLNEHKREIDLKNFQEHEQDIILPPKQRVLVNYSVRTFVTEQNLQLQQKIKGTLIAMISYSNSEKTTQITIKEAMRSLKKFNLLPREVVINEDNSITFNGRAKLIVKRESEPKIIRNFYDI